MNRKQKERIEKEKLRDEENSKQTQPKIDAGKYLFILLQTEKTLKKVWPITYPNIFHNIFYNCHFLSNLNNIYTFFITYKKLGTI